MSESNTELRKILARNVRALRSQKEISQEQLANICELHRTYIGSVERMERNVTLGTLIKFANALNVTVVDLLTQRENIQ
jgi:transcriptional regulator with XRE-family HTH domain